MLSDPGAWEQWAICEEPHTAPLPCDWQDKVGDRFAKLLVLKAFREEKVVFGCAQVGCGTHTHTHTDTHTHTTTQTHDMLTHTGVASTYMIKFVLFLKAL